MDDLISRQAAIDALDEIESEVADGYGYQYEKWRKYFCGLPSAQPEIVRCKDCKLFGNSEQLPSAQQERKTGRWVERNPQNSPDCRLIECSECGNAYIVGYNIDYDDWIDGRNFCMKCGADLRGGNNGKNT